ncbi:MAG: DUF4349 domain-containing protein [Lachnospiraceae bacterium]|nr:DUF4349 domain-containing protein [Lachnospiraceae bacterium]
MKKCKWISIALLTAALCAAGCGSTSSSGYDASYNYAAEDSGVTSEGWRVGEVSEESLEDYDSTVDASMTDAEQQAVEAEGETSERKLIRNMELSLETTGFDEVLAVIEDKAEETGGYIEYSSVNGTAERSNRYSYLTVRIPSGQLDSFVDAVGDSATVLSSSTSVQDVTLSYSDLAAHISSLRIEQETLMEMLAQADSIDTIITIQNELTNIRYQLESYESQMKLLENQISYSTVTIDLREVRTPTVQEKEGFFTRLKYTFVNSVSDLAEGIQDFLIFFFGNILTILVVLGLIVLVLFLISRLFRLLFRRKESGAGRKGKTEGRKWFRKKSPKMEAKIDAGDSDTDGIPVPEEERSGESGSCEDSKKE